MAIGDVLTDLPTTIAVPTKPGVMGSPGLGSPESEVERFIRAGPVWSQELPGLGAMLLCDGWSPVRHFLEGDLYRTGLLAPFAAPTINPSGAKASGQGVFTADPANGTAPVHSLQIAVGSTPATMKFVTTLDTSGLSGNQVQRGNGRLQTAQNFQALLNDGAGHGSTYVNAIRALGFSTWSFATLYKVTCTNVEDNQPAAGNTRVTVQATEFGSHGNNFYLKDSAPNGYDLGTDFTEPAGGLLSGGSDGSGSAPDANVYEWGHAHVREPDGAQSAVSPLVEETLGQAMNVDVESAEQSADDADTTHVRYFRTLQEGGVLYRIGEVKRGSVPDNEITDDNLDTALVDVGALPYDESLYRPYGSGHIPRFKYVVSHLGSLFGAGQIPRSTYDVGDATVSAGSREVTLAGGAVVSDDMEGMTFRSIGDGHIDAYRVNRVDKATTKLYLNEGWRGGALVNDAYTLEDEDDPHTIHYTPPLLYNSWPPGLSLRGVSSASEEGITGLISMWESLIIFTLDGVWRLSGSSIESFQLRKVAKNSGCYAGKSIAAAEGMLFWVGPDGVWVWSGGGQPALISKPRVQGGVVRGCDGTIQRINEDAAELIHGRYCPGEKIIRWWLPLDGSFSPTVALTYDLQTGAWGHDAGPEITAEANVFDQGNVRHTLVGTAQGTIFEADVGYSDGAYPTSGNMKAALTGTPTRRSLTGTFATGTVEPGAVGLLIDAAGNFEQFVVGSYSTSEIVPAHPLSSAPAAGDVVILGAINVLARSGRFDVGVHERIMGVTDFDVGYVPLGDGTNRLFFASAGDQDALLLPGLSQATYADLSKAIGTWRFAAAKRCRFFQFELRHFITGQQIQLLQYAFHLRLRAKARSSR